MALVLDDGALALTVGAHALRLHHAEDGALRAYDVATAVARRTLLGVAAAVLGAAAVTVRACHLLAHLELLGDARGTLFQRQAHLKAQVAAAVLRLASAASAAETSSEAEASERCSPAEEVAEDIAEL